MKIEACDYTQISMDEARELWENGDFSSWVDEHGGFPFDIGDERFYCWDGVEEALSD